jgi:hypothetical protein
MQRRLCSSCRLPLCHVCVAAGPALCVAVRGISGMPADRLAQLMSLFSGSVGAPANRSSAGIAPGGSAAAGQSGAAVVQMGLASAWAVTDVLQVCNVLLCRVFHTHGLTVHVNHVAACCIRRVCVLSSLRCS